MAGTGAARHLLAVGDRTPMAADVAPFLEHVAAAAGKRLDLLQAAPLLLAREMEPEFQDQRALVGQHQLEPVDGLQLALEGVVVDHLEHPILERLVVPGAEHDAELALGREVAPVAPHARPGPLHLVGLAIGMGAQMMWIEPLVEPLDRAPLAGAIDPATSMITGKLLRSTASACAASSASRSFGSSSLKVALSRTWDSSADSNIASSPGGGGCDRAAGLIQIKALRTS